MASIKRNWSGIDDAALLRRIARADDRAFTEFVGRYAMYVATLASRILGTSPPTDLSIAVFTRIWSLALEGPADPVAVKGWVLDLARAISLEYREGTYRDATRIDEDERRSLARQIEEHANLFREIEDYLAHHPSGAVAPREGRVGIARGRYIVTPAFDDPLSEFEEYA